MLFLLFHHLHHLLLKTKNKKQNTRKAEAATRYGDGLLVLDSVASMPDAPYGDHFTIIERWVVRAHGRGSGDGGGGGGSSSSSSSSAAPVVTLQVFVEVKFSKFTMVKRLILSHSLKSIQSAYEQWLGRAQAKISELYS